MLAMKTLPLLFTQAESNRWDYSVHVKFADHEILTRMKQLNDIDRKKRYKNEIIKCKSAQTEDRNIRMLIAKTHNDTIQEINGTANKDLDCLWECGVAMS